MRILDTLIAAFWLPAVLLADPTSEVWRPPQPVPSACESMRFEAVLVDVSKSMKRGGLFEQTRKNIEEYLAKAAPCTLVVLGSFGVTADVHDAQFLATSGARARLMSAVSGLRATHTSTNLDEAAKLVELLSYQLRATYGAPANRLIVRVYSDFESSPSTGKPNFSLGEYLARRMDARYMRVSAGDNPAEQTVNVQTDQAAKEVQTSRPPEAGRVSRQVVTLGVAGGVILLAGMMLLVWLRARSSKSRPRAGGLGALLVTESAIAAEEGPPAAVGPERRIEVAAGVPAVFSTDATSATYIAAVVPGGANGELFRVEPLPDGSVRIQSLHPRLTVNDEPLDVDRRLKVNIREPIRVRLGPREFNIVGVFGRPRALEGADDVFDAEALQH